MFSNIISGAMAALLLTFVPVFLLMAGLSLALGWHYDFQQIIGTWLVVAGVEMVWVMVLASLKVKSS